MRVRETHKLRSLLSTVPGGAAQVAPPGNRAKESKMLLMFLWALVKDASTSVLAPLHETDESARCALAEVPTRTNGARLETVAAGLNERTEFDRFNIDFCETSTVSLS